ncbi:MAG: TonB family protein [Bacteroidota bacterium]
MSQIIKADLDEMVFEERERRYGAYFLRKRYIKHLAIGVAAVCLLFTAMATVPSLDFGPKEEAIKRKKIVTEINLADLPESLEEEKPEEEPPPPPPPPKPPQLKQIAFKIPEPAPEEEVDPDEEVIEMDSLKEAPAIGLENIDGALEGVFDGEIDGEGEPDIIAETDPEPNINDFIFDAEEPKPVNMDDIRKLIGYPDIAKDAGIEGSVVVRVLVDKYGNYKKHKVIKKVHPVLAKACEKHVSKLKFTPAIQGGKPIPFWVNIPFKFKLIQ